MHSPNSTASDMNPTPSVLPIEAGQQEPDKTLVQKAAVMLLHGTDDQQAEAVNFLAASAKAYIAANPPAQEAAEPSEAGMQRAIAIIEKLRDDHCAGTRSDPDPGNHCEPDSARCEFVSAWNDAIAALQAPAQKDAP